MNEGRKDPLRNCAGNWKHCGLTAGAASLPSLRRLLLSFLPSVVGNGADVTGRRPFLAPQKVESRISLNSADSIVALFALPPYTTVQYELRVWSGFQFGIDSVVLSALLSLSLSFSLAAQIDSSFFPRMGFPGAFYWRDKGTKHGRGRGRGRSQPRLNPG